MMHTFRPLFAVVLICAFLGSGCGFVTAKPPVMRPTVAAAVTIGVQALLTILQLTPNVQPVVLNAVLDAQKALSQDIAGATWGTIVRELLTTIYTQLPWPLQNDVGVQAVLAGLEAALATIGA